MLGICGGMQMLGEHVEAADERDGGGAGLALLPLHTAFRERKQTARIATRFRELSEPWEQLSGRELAGYLIRHMDAVRRRPRRSRRRSRTGSVS